MKTAPFRFHHGRNLPKPPISPIPAHVSIHLVHMTDPEPRPPHPIKTQISSSSRRGSDSSLIFQFAIPNTTGGKRSRDFYGSSALQDPQLSDVNSSPREQRDLASPQVISAAEVASTNNQGSSDRPSAFGVWLFLTSCAMRRLTAQPARTSWWLEAGAVGSVRVTW